MCSMSLCTILSYPLCAAKVRADHPAEEVREAWAPWERRRLHAGREPTFAAMRRGD